MPDQDVSPTGTFFPAYPCGIPAEPGSTQETLLKLLRIRIMPKNQFPPRLKKL
jgi:hypothetical protein